MTFWKKLFGSSLSDYAGIIVKRGDSVIFTCPGCQVPSLYKLKIPVKLNYPNN